MSIDAKAAMHAGNLFAEARHVHVLRQMHLVRPSDRGEMTRRILLAAAAAWLPLALLARGDFLTDIAVHVRMLLAVPLLIASEYMVIPRLEAIGRHIGASSMLAPSLSEALAGVVARARKASAGNVTACVMALVVYATVGLLVVFLPPGAGLAWQHSPTGHGLSAAGLWHALVSLPILLALTMGWLWRLLVWTWFLRAVSRLGLGLLPSHPDRAGGLQFIAFSPRVFVPVVLAMATVVAGTLADEVFLRGQSPIGREATPAVTAFVLVLAFMAPPLVFTRALLVAWRNGVFMYGELAARMGTRFEEKWLDVGLGRDGNPLEAPDFSATVDLYGVVANVYGMKLLLVEYPGMVMLAVAALVPFIPIWLHAVPLRTLAAHVLGALF
jgi:hypothetical protein